MRRAELREVRLWSEGRGLRAVALGHDEADNAPMRDSFKPGQAKRTSVPGVIYGLLNTFWLLASVLQTAS